MKMKQRETYDLPVLKLLAFTLAGFITIMTETVPAGLLPLISKDLHVSTALAGQMVSVYAFGSVISAIPIILYTRSWSRKKLFIFALILILFFNTLTAISLSYEHILIYRFIAGVGAGVIWGILAGYARNIVKVSQQGKAMAVVGIGQPIALCMGIPLGAWLGDIIGWRGVFLTLSILTTFLTIWVIISIPNLFGQKELHQKPLKNTLSQRGIVPLLLIIFLWIFAHNLLYTFISSYLTSVHLNHQIDLILLIFGVSSIIGIIITGKWIDQYLRKLLLISLVVFIFSALIMGYFNNQIWLVITGIILWGLAFGGAPTLLQTSMANLAGDHVDIAQSMLVTVFNLAVMGGALMGGLILEKIGVYSFFNIMVELSILSLLIIKFSKINTAGQV